METVIKNKKVYEGTSVVFETIQGDNDEPEFCIWFEYINGTGNKSSTPKVSIKKDCIQDLADYWKEQGLLS